MGEPYYARPVTVTDERIRDAMERQAKQKALRESLDSQMRDQRRGGVGEPAVSASNPSFNGTIGMSKGAMRRMKIEQERQEMAMQQQYSGGGGGQRPPLYGGPPQQQQVSSSTTTLPQLYPSRGITSQGGPGFGGQFPQSTPNVPSYNGGVAHSFDGTFGPGGGGGGGGGPNQFGGTFTQHPSPGMSAAGLMGPPGGPGGIYGQPPTPLAGAGGAYAGHIPPPPPPSSQPVNVRNSTAAIGDVMKFVSMATTDESIYALGKNDGGRGGAPQQAPQSSHKTRTGGRGKVAPQPAPGQQEWFEFSDDDDDAPPPSNHYVPPGRGQQQRPTAPQPKSRGSSNVSQQGQRNRDPTPQGRNRDPTPQSRGGPGGLHSRGGVAPAPVNPKDQHRLEVQANSKVNKLASELAAQQSVMEKMKEKERIWEMQVSKLKTELKQAKQKEKDFTKLAHRAETAPQGEGSTKRTSMKESGGGALPAKKVRNLQPISGGGKNNNSNNMQHELNGTVKFGDRKPFRPITAPVGPEELQQSDDEEEDTRAPPLVQRTVVGYDDPAPGGRSPLLPHASNTFQQQPVANYGSSKNGKGGTNKKRGDNQQQQVAQSCASPHPEEYPLMLETLIDISKSQVITLRQAEQLWELFAGDRISLVPTPPAMNNMNSSFRGTQQSHKSPPLEHQAYPMQEGSFNGSIHSGGGPLLTMPPQREELLSRGLQPMETQAEEGINEADESYGADSDHVPSPQRGNANGGQQQASAPVVIGSPKSSNAKNNTATKKPRAKNSNSATSGNDFENIQTYETVSELVLDDPDEEEGQEDVEEQENYSSDNEEEAEADDEDEEEEEEEDDDEADMNEIDRKIANRNKPPATIVATKKQTASLRSSAMGPDF